MPLLRNFRKNYSQRLRGWSLNFLPKAERISFQLPENMLLSESQKACLDFPYSSNEENGERGEIALILESQLEQGPI